MENRVERILHQTYAAVAELDATFGEYPTKIILGANVHNLIYEYVTLCYDTSNECKYLATLFNIPVSVDNVNVNRICVCIENTTKFRKEVFING